MTSAMNLAIARPKPLFMVGVVDVAVGGQHGLAVGQHVAMRRLMGDEDAHVGRMRGDQGQRIHRASAAGEQVDRPTAEVR